MKLTVLVDNNTFIDEYYCGEPAVSYYMEDEGHRILLDAGYSDVFMRNAEAMGIDLGNLDFAVFSHGHNDHTGGLPHLLEVPREGRLNVVVHSHAFLPKTEGCDLIGSPLTINELEDRCRLLFTDGPAIISPNITFLGEIPGFFDFERREVIGTLHKQDCVTSDLVLDDTALVYRGDEGLSIITGCSHSGICNIMEYAKEVCGDTRIHGVIGGFHLFDVNNRLHETIRYFKKNQVKELYPCHCVSFAAKAEIHKVIPIQEVGVGKVLEW